jgi:predicted membrane protein
MYNMKGYRMRYLMAVTFVFALILGGCVSLAPQSFDSEAKEFIVPEGKASIYVVSPWTVMGCGAEWPINMNGKIIGKMNKGKYYWILAEPGNNFITLVDQNRTIVGPFTEIDVFYFETQPNKAYFINNSIFDKIQLLDCLTSIIISLQRQLILPFDNNSYSITRSS